MKLHERHFLSSASAWALVAVLLSAVCAFGQDPPPPEDMPGMASGLGTQFNINLDDTVNFIITAEDPIDVVIHAFSSQSLEIAFNAMTEVEATQITVSGLPPGAELFKSEDDLRNHSVITVDDQGTFTWLQDLTAHHSVLFKPEPSTWYLGDGGWTPKGTVIQKDHTYSAWYQLEGSPATDIPYPDRHFILETYGIGAAWSASYGVRDWGSGDVGNVHTYTASHQGPNVTFTGACGTEWHNILVTYDADAAGAEHAIYLDGIFVMNMASESALHETLGLMIGTYRDHNDRFFNGLIDDVAFWDRVVTSTEIAAIQQNAVGTINGIEDGLVAYWNFDDDFAATNGGAAFDGTPFNGPEIVASGKFSGSVRFQRALKQWVQVDVPVLIQEYSNTHVPGTWDPVTKTAVLTEDVNETIQIIGTGITLDGGGNSINASGYGIYVSGESGVTIRNANVRGTSYGIYSRHSPETVIENNTVWGNSYGIYIYDTRSGQPFMVRDNQVDGRYRAFRGYVRDNSPQGSVVSNNTFHSNYYEPVYLINYGSSPCRIYNNNFISDRQRAPYFYGSSLVANGNYWNTWISPDTDFDGIVDNPYNTGRGYDYLPYTTPNGWLQVEPEPPSLVALYPFNGEANDLSENLNHPLSINSISYNAGFEGQAADFNGASSYIDIPVNIGPDGYPEITFGAWVNTRNNGSDQKARAILSNDNCCYDRQIGLDPRWGGPGWTAFCGDNGTQGVNSGIVNAGSWTFVAVHYGGGQTTLFIDGQVFGPTIDTTGPGATNARIGKNPNYNDYFDGLIDNLFIISGSITNEQIQAIGQNGIGELASMFSLAVAVTGTVTSDCGGPLAGVTVELQGTDGETLSAVTGEDGTYTFASITSGIGCDVTVVLPEKYAFQAPETGTINFAELTADAVADFSLGCLFDVIGTVSSNCDGPMAGVTVHLQETDGELLTGVTEPDGSCLFGDLAFGSGFSVTVDPPAGYGVVAPGTPTITIESLTADTTVDYALGCPVDVSGTVFSDCIGPLPGVTVGLDLGDDGEYFPVATDSIGTFLFEDVPYGSGADLTCVLPLGFHAADPIDGHTGLDLTQDSALDFALDCVAATGAARGMGYWKHQANVYIKGRGNAHESEEDMRTNFPAAIFDHFHENGLNAIAVEGVTYIGAGTHVPLDLATIQSTLTVSGGRNMLDRAKQHYLALLLNLASGKIQTFTVVSDDGRTASEALQFVASLINAGGDENAQQSIQISEALNEALMLGAGTIPEDIGYIAYRPGQGGLPQVVTMYQNAPNPFNPMTKIAFALPTEQSIRIEVYALNGRRIAILADEVMSRGRHEVIWAGVDGAGRSVASGAYFYRLNAGDFSETRRMLLLK